MHISEPRAYSTLINHIIKVYELEQGPLGLIGVLTPSKFNSEVDSTSHYKELITL